MASRSRAEWVRMEKGSYPDHMTSGELAAYLGIDKRTLRRMLKIGKIPDPARFTSSGWQLWSPEQVTGILRTRVR